MSYVYIYICLKYTCIYVYIYSTAHVTCAVLYTHICIFTCYMCCALHAYVTCAVLYVTCAVLYTHMLHVLCFTRIYVSWKHKCIYTHIYTEYIFQARRMQYVYIHTYINIYVYIYTYTCKWTCTYGVATISRLLKIIGLFCRISSLLQDSFAKETYQFEEPTDRSHPIWTYIPYEHTCLHTRNHVYMWLRSVGSLKW